MLPDTDIDDVKKQRNAVPSSRKTSMSKCIVLRPADVVGYAFDTP
jgi:hypothetical protein